MRRLFRENGLTLVFIAAFVAAVVAQAIAGHHAYDHGQLSHHDETISFWRFVTSSSFAADLSENWQSEFLQTVLFVVATIWLVQRGSPESNPVRDGGLPSDQQELIGEHARDDSPRVARRGGLLSRLYSHSLSIVVTLLFFGSWFAQAVAGRVDFNEEQIDHQEATVSLAGYIGTGDFWNRTFQNWQSEFLALAASAVLAVYLRQRGSTQSKPVGMPHGVTNVED